MKAEIKLFLYFFSVRFLKYLCNPDNQQDFIDKIQKCWQRRRTIKEQLDHKIPSIKEQARRNFSQIKEALEHMGIG